MFNNELYTSQYHKLDLSQYSFLITGGAGFIGANLVEYLLRYGAGHVRVLDNLSNGYYENIKDFLNLPNFEFIQGDILNLETCKNVVKGMDFVSHQAALGSVPRSINDPITTNNVNITGFLNMLVAAKESSTIKQFVYAASSSSYGDSQQLPKKEGQEGKPLSPYAVTKLVNELYADVFSRVYGFHTIGLRYFNVFGPKQNPNNPYAAVIPIFCKHFINRTAITVNGDGQTSRDFTFIENVIQANIKALLYQKTNEHLVMNVACGDQITLNHLIELLTEISETKLIVNYDKERKGDIKHSKADISRIKQIIEYDPKITFKIGLLKTYKWYYSNQKITR